ncbi:hypothetical protein R1sor_015734 [Riccia sorocarpa]|uniref:Uncharacterized protein n=1 Tax=Riccia sorocarpa TaxID=122646 RepID=A0ABD3HGF0_9MARC
MATPHKQGKSSPLPLGDWADIVDEDVMITEARGAKGRPEIVTDHTPDRGSVSKKRPIPRSPQWDLRDNTDVTEAPLRITDGRQGEENPSSASWTRERAPLVEEIQHHGGHIVGDHIPVRAKLRLEARSEARAVRNYSYFKINAGVLKQQEAWEEIKKIWEDHPTDCTDARTRWNKGWGRIRKYCRELQLKQKNQNQIKLLRDEVEERRRLQPRDCTEAETEDLAAVEDSLHALENEEATQWFLRSRSKTLREGEAPTKFFFESAKARFTRDRIAALKTEAGETITSNEEILQIVEDFYADLYSSNGESLESRLARLEVLQLITRRIAESDREQIDDLPTTEEIDLTDFQRARTAIGKFELASGALLNIQKSMVMALGNSCNLEWLRNSGCEVAGWRHRFRFLGIWSGRGISHLEVTEKIVVSIEKKFNLWANKYLSFTSRILLFKHVLSAIPAHYLMTVGLDNKGLARVNRSIRNFLWGFGEGGKPKTPLIGWEKIHRDKEAGGLGWVDLQSRMKVNLANKIMRLLNQDGDKASWVPVRLALAMITRQCSNSFRNVWTSQEILLLAPGLRIKQAPTLRGDAEKALVPGGNQQTNNGGSLDPIWYGLPSASKVEQLSHWRWKDLDNSAISDFRTIGRRNLQRITTTNMGREMETESESGMPTPTCGR